MAVNTGQEGDSTDSTYFLGNHTNPPLTNFDTSIIWQVNAGALPTLQPTYVSEFDGAVTIAWTGGSSGSWDDAGNWDMGVVPVSSDVVEILGGRAHNPTLASDISINSLKIDAGSTLTLNGHSLTLDPAGTFSNDGTFKLQGTETLTNLTQYTNGGTWEYVGAGGGPQTYTLRDFGNEDYYNLKINPTNGLDTFVVENPLYIGNDLTIATGTLQATAVTSGLVAQYYSDMNLGTLVGTFVEPQINFNAGEGANRMGQSDNFSIRWSGQVKVDATDDYIFNTQTDDGERLWIDGNEIINHWSDHGTDFTNSAPIHLTGGTWHTITMEYYENGGFADAFLSIASASNGYADMALVPPEDFRNLSSGQDIEVDGNWSNTGTFTTGQSTVTLSGFNQTVTGSTEFPSLTKICGYCTLTFGAGSTQTIDGTLDLEGDLNGNLKLRSTVPGTQWSISAAENNLSLLDVKDSNNTSAGIFAFDTYVDSGNNNRWLFAASPGVPTSVNAVSDGHRAINVSWAAPEINSHKSPATSYDVRYQAPGDGNFWIYFNDLSSSTLSYWINNLGYNAQYSVDVRATNDFGSSDWVGPITVDTGSEGIYHINTCEDLQNMNVDIW